MTPKVSVVTTLYNYADYVGDAVTSFLRQDMQDSEMIVVDDASTDDPLPRIEKAAAGDPRVRYVRLSSNGGYSKAKNIGIREARGEYLAMLDADDMLTERGLTVRYEKIVEGFDLVHGPVLDFRDGRLKRSKLWAKWADGPKDASCFRQVHAQGVMVRRDVHSRVGLYDESLRCKSDREMWARVFNRGLRIGWVTDDVAIYRLHPRQMHKSKEKLRINEQLQKEVDAKINRRKYDLSDVQML